MQTHDVSEWATVLGLCTGVTAVLLVPVRLALDHEPLDWHAVAGRCERALLLTAAEITRLRVVLVGLLLAAVVHLDPTTAAPKKGALR